MSGWGGEALFAGLLYPEKKAGADKLFSESCRELKLSEERINSIPASVGELCRKWVAKKDFSRFPAVGFSVCFNQLFSSIYVARLIKELCPTAKIIFGGSSCSGEAGRTLLSHVEEIDFVIDGEGEEQLLQLCYRLADEKERRTKTRVVQESRLQTGSTADKCNLNELPFPDFSDYFSQAKALFGQNHFIPILPVEFSRGCWWNKCTFCNLNLQWQNYRFKSALRMDEEIRHHVSTYETLNFAFTDNALPPREADTFFASCRDSGFNLDFFGEIRSLTSIQRLALHRQGGLRSIQVGVEALSTSLLAKMRKGTTTIDNIAVMKNCLATGIQIEGNLIVEFPGTTEQEIEETLTNLDFVLPFHPLQTATFFLGYGSPIHHQPDSYGIRAIFPHHKYRKLLPAELVDKLQFMVCDYRGDRGRQRKLWRPVRNKVARWQEFHATHQSAGSPTLSYRDGKTFLIIRQELPGMKPLRHRLRGTSRKIYLFCESPQTFTSILHEFGNISAQALQSFVTMMVAKRLMFQEREKVLALAVSDP